MDQKSHGRANPRECVTGGHDIAVDLDLETLFDQVNRGVIMSRLTRRCEKGEP
jgi:hypothetical protein